MLITGPLTLAKTSQAVPFVAGDEVDVYLIEGHDWCLPCEPLAGFAIVDGHEVAAFKAATGGHWTAPPATLRRAKYLPEL